MAALIITVGNVVRVSGIPKVGEALETITAGQALYTDGTTNNLGHLKVGLADANDAAVLRTCIGISIGAALTGQPVIYLGDDGDVIGFGSILTANIGYIVGATAGSINPASDLAATWYLEHLGWAITTSNLQLKRFNSGVVTA